MVHSTMTCWGSHPEQSLSSYNYNTKTEYGGGWYQEVAVLMFLNVKIIISKVPVVGTLVKECLHIKWGHCRLKCARTINIGIIIFAKPSLQNLLWNTCTKCCISSREIASTRVHSTPPDLNIGFRGNNQQSRNSSSQLNPGVTPS